MSDSLGPLVVVSSAADRRGSLPRTVVVTVDSRELPVCHADPAWPRRRLLVCCTAGCWAQVAVVSLARCKLLLLVDDPRRYPAPKVPAVLRAPTSRLDPGLSAAGSGAGSGSTAPPVVSRMVRARAASAAACSTTAAARMPARWAAAADARLLLARRGAAWMTARWAAAADTRLLLCRK